MMSQMWASVQGKLPSAPPGVPMPGVPPAGSMKVALGEAVGGPILSELPHNQGKVAEKVRALADKRVEEAWTRLKEEVKVQKLVWESLSISKGKEKPAEVGMLEARLDQCLEAKVAGDVSTAHHIVEQVARAADQGADLLNRSTLGAVRDILKQDSLTAKRRDLAERVDMSHTPATLPRTAADKKDLEAFVVACELKDARLERKVREFLLLPIPQELGAPVTGKTSGSLGPGASAVGSRKTGSGMSLMSAPVAFAGSRTLSQIVGGPAGRTGSGMLRGSSTGAVVKASDSIRSDMPLTMKAGTAAAKVRALANEAPGLSWKKLEEEFEVQKLVWESLIITKGKLDRTLAGQVSAKQSRIEEILSIRVADPEAAMASLEDMLPKPGEESELLNCGVQNAAKAVLSHHRLAPYRSQLAERLATASVPATLPRGNTEKKQMEQLVAKCELGDPNLTLVARQLLLLVPMSADQFSSASGKKSVSLGLGAGAGPVASATPSMSGGPAASAMRRTAMSTGALPRGPNNPARQSPIQEGQEPVFMPKARIIEAI